MVLPAGVVNEDAINELDKQTPIEEVPDNKENDCSRRKQVQPIESRRPQERQKYLRSFFTPVRTGLCVGLLIQISLIIALLVVVNHLVECRATTNLTLHSTPIPNRSEPTTAYPKSDLGVSSDLDPPVEQVNRDQNTETMIIGRKSIGRGKDIILRCLFPFNLDHRNFPDDVHWWHNGEEIYPNDISVTMRVDMKSGFAFLKIGNAHLADSGKYTCQWLKDGVTVSAAPVYITVV